MQHLFPELPESEIEAAKERLWSKIEGRLMHKELRPYGSVVDELKQVGSMDMSLRLKQAQMKEHLLNSLPDRKPVEPIFTQRGWAVGTVMAMLGVVFLPIFQTPGAMASLENTLEVVQGEVTLNGSSVTGTVFVQEGDEIKSGANALAHMQFADDSRVTLGPDTALSLVEVNINPRNRAQSEVVLQQSSGRLWTQVVNLVSKKSTFAVLFPEGRVEVTQRASFDLEVNEHQSEVHVAGNWVSVFGSKDWMLSQGEMIVMDPTPKVEALRLDDQDALWWSFNQNYGQEYARHLDATYRNEAVERVHILPGNPLYGLKTFREEVQEALSFSASSRRELMAYHANNRLAEAQVLLDQGRQEEAEDVLAEYTEKVEALGDSAESEMVLAQVVETQKGLLAKPDLTPEDALMDEHVQAASVTVVAPEEQTDVLLESASQKLALVPDAIAAGNLEGAMALLASYQASSRSVLVQLSELPLEEREAKVTALLDQKIQDIQILRIIATSPEMNGVVDANAQILQEMSMMALTLRQNSLAGLDDFFTQTTYDVQVQKQIYEQLKASSDLTPKMQEQFAVVEEAAAEALDVPHASESQDQAQASEEATQNPEPHNDL